MTALDDLTQAISTAFSDLYSGDDTKGFRIGDYSEFSKFSNIESQLLYIKEPSNGLQMSDKLLKHGKGEMTITLSITSAIKNDSGNGNRYAQLVDSANTLFQSVITKLFANNRQYMTGFNQTLNGVDLKNVPPLQYVVARFTCNFTITVC